jgi:hypothetical protein
MHAGVIAFPIISTRRYINLYLLLLKSAAVQTVPDPARQACFPYGSRKGIRTERFEKAAQAAERLATPAFLA